MSLDDLIFEKVEAMEREQAIEILFSILLTANEWERRSKAIDKLIGLNDSDHFSEIRSMYLNESHSQAKIKLIEMLSTCYGKQGIDLLKTQYKNEKDGKVRKKIIQTINKGDTEESIPILIEALSDANIKCK